MNVNPSPTENRFYDWTVRITFSPYEIPQRFMVLVFLGSVPSDPKDWLTSPSLVGSCASYTPTFPRHPPKNPNIKTECFVSLNDAISDHPELQSRIPSVVGPYLDKELKWRVQTLDCTPVTLKSLEVEILYTIYTFPPGADVPVPEGEPHHWEPGTGNNNDIEA